MTNFFLGVALTLCALLLWMFLKLSRVVGNVSTAVVRLSETTVENSQSIAKLKSNVQITSTEGIDTRARLEVVEEVVSGWGTKNEEELH